MISCALPPNKSAFSKTHEIAAATSTAPAGQVAAGASRYETWAATSPLPAAKHMAFSTSPSGAAGAWPPENSSPAMNTSIGRLASGRVCAVAISRMLRSSPPYFRFRVNVTPAGQADSAGAVGGTGEASADAGGIGVDSADSGGEAASPESSATRQPLANDGPGNSAATIINDAIGSAITDLPA